MANHANLVITPCKLGVALTTTSVPNAGAVFRTPRSQPPTDVSSGSSTPPPGPQLWPLKL
jgi:hypothetical protein